jgi:hypothetical protein
MEGLMRKLVLLLATPALVGAAPPPPRLSPPGEGVLCMMVFVDVAAEVGRRCFPGQNLPFQTRVESAEAKFDAYVLKNGPATPAQLAAFKKDQARIGSPAFECNAGGDLVQTYKNFLAVDPNFLTTEVDKLLARPGRPTFGDCV